jgi:hypothetical protein
VLLTLEVVVAQALVVTVVAVLAAVPHILIMPLQILAVVAVAHGMPQIQVLMVVLVSSSSVTPVRKKAQVVM